MSARGLAQTLLRFKPAGFLSLGVLVGMSLFACGSSAQTAVRAEVLLRNRYGGDYSVIAIGGLNDVGGSERARTLWCVEENSSFYFEAHWYEESEALTTELVDRVVGDHLGSMLECELSNVGIESASWSKVYTIGDVDRSYEDLIDPEVCVTFLTDYAPLSITTSLYLPDDTDVAVASNVIAEVLASFNESYAENTWRLIVVFVDSELFGDLKSDLSVSPDGEIVQREGDNVYLSDLYESRNGYARLSSEADISVEAVSSALEVVAYGEQRSE